MTTKVESVKPSAASGPRPRKQSAISSPYFDHKASVGVAEVVQNIGGGSAAPDFLASKLGYKSINSGTFLTRVASARAFGYVATLNGNYVVTDRGRAIVSPVMPEDAINAKADGFLAVPLFARVYEDHKGRTIPPLVGLANLFRNYGIIPDRIKDAVRVFMSSAEQCGFFDAAKDRLIRPVVNAPIALNAPQQEQRTPAVIDVTPTMERSRRRGGNDGDGGDYDPLIQGLLDRLPPADSEFPLERRVTWLKAMVNSLELIYGAGDKPIKIDA